MNPKQLPNWPPRQVWEISVALSVLDAIEKDDGYTMKQIEDRAFRITWDCGDGNALHAWLCADGMLIVGFDHESPCSPYESGALWAGLYVGMPQPLRRFVQRTFREHQELFPGNFEPGGPSIPLLEATFAVWWTKESSRWQCGPTAIPGGDPGADGSGLLKVLSLEHWNGDRHADPRLLEWVAAHKPLLDGQMKALSRGCDPVAVRAVMSTLGYGKAPNWLPA